MDRGHLLRSHLRHLSMVVDNLDIVGISVGPPETYAPLVVDANAELIFSIAGEFLQSVPGRHSKIIKRLRRIDHIQSHQRSTLDFRGQLPGPFSPKDSFRLTVAERPNHSLDNNASR